MLWGPMLLGCFSGRLGVYISVHSLALVKLSRRQYSGSERSGCLVMMCPGRVSGPPDVLWLLLCSNLRCVHTMTSLCWQHLSV